MHVFVTVHSTECMPLSIPKFDSSLMKGSTGKHKLSCLWAGLCFRFAHTSVHVGGGSILSVVWVRLCERYFEVCAFVDEPRCI